MAQYVSIEEHQSLNYFAYHLTNGPMEGTNNKIKVLKLELMAIEIKIVSLQVFA